MTTMHSTDWRRALVEAYPDLFHPHGHPPVAQGWPEIGDGWKDLLRRACRRIRAAVRADGGSFCAAQIKEKYGTLRFYWQGSLSADAVARVEEAIALAEARSATTCDVCGEEGRLVERERAAILAVAERLAAKRFLSGEEVADILAAARCAVSTDVPQVALQPAEDE